MEIGQNDVLAFIFGVILLIIIGRLFLTPIKFILKIALNSAFGLFILFIVNFFGKAAGLTVGINWLTGLICGVLGIPGVVLVLLLKWLGYG
ncbi:MAG: pro-sigmaK processing inhibitor BofA family protein [Clostridia bacterium]|nr:pro-sigmaK processing inhibitor BofA family protein [Clostridia bacterium]